MLITDAALDTETIFPINPVKSNMNEEVSNHGKKFPRPKVTGLFSFHNII